jgi:hypothetical protein
MQPKNSQVSNKLDGPSPRIHPNQDLEEYMLLLCHFLAITAVDSMILQLECYTEQYRTMNI